MPHAHRTRTPPRASRKTTWRERVFVLGGLAVAVLATAFLPAFGTGADLVGPIWLAAVAWTVVAQIAHVLWLGIRHGDWSGFGNHPPHPDREDEHDWTSRTGRYSYRRYLDDRHLRDSDDLRDHDRQARDHGAMP